MSLSRTSKTKNRFDLKTSKPIYNVLSNEEKKKFYPQLSSRILLFLRQQRYRRREILTEDIIKKFKKSKSEISHVLSFLTKKQYINKEYVNNLKNQGSRHRVVLNEKGLEVAEAILSEGLDPIELKAIEASIKRKRKTRFRERNFEVKS